MQQIIKEMVQVGSNLSSYYIYDRWIQDYIACEPDDERYRVAIEQWVKSYAFSKPVKEYSIVFFDFDESLNPNFVSTWMLYIVYKDNTSETLAVSFMQVVVK